MRCCKSPISSFCYGLLLLFAVTAAQASDIAIRNPQLTANDDGFSLAADFNINFNSRLEEAVNKGVPLFFTADFELFRSRWYWLDEQIVRRNKTFQLSFHALTRQYRLSTGALHQNFASLEDALHVMTRLRNWQVLEKGDIRPDQTYLVSLRLRLDLSLMPKTFQVSALINKDWNLSSDWQRWKFTATDVLQPPTAPQPSPQSALPLTSPAASEVK